MSWAEGQTHCRRGHLLAPDNILVKGRDGARRCRECYQKKGTSPEAKERRRERDRQKYIRNRDRILARNRKWNHEHPEKNRERQRRWAEEHPGYWRKWQREHPEKMAEYARKQRAKHPEREAARGRRRYQALVDKAAAYDEFLKMLEEAVA